MSVGRLPSCSLPLLFMLFMLQPAVAKRYRLSRWDIPKANYSGITPLGGQKYAVVSDEQPEAGFYVWTLRMDSVSGKITDVRDDGFYGLAWPFDRDAEGIAFCPQRNTLFVSGEEDQRILEHRLDGTLTGEEIRVPQYAGKAFIQYNRGFEALGYDPREHLFWTVTESPLKADEALHLRMMSFGLDLKLVSEYTYSLDPPQARNQGRDHYHGVVAVTPFPGGGLLVLEREARIARAYNGSRCWCKLFLYNPLSGQKKLLERWSTRFHLFNTRFSNYEGMCLGPVLTDGTQTLLLLADSQGGSGVGPWRLRDRLKVIRLNPEKTDLHFLEY